MRRVGVGFRGGDVLLRVAVMRTHREVIAVGVEHDAHQSPVLAAPDELRVRRAAELAHTDAVGHFDFAVFAEYGDMRGRGSGHNSRLGGNAGYLRTPARRRI